MDADTKTAQKECVEAFWNFYKGEEGHRDHLWNDYVQKRERFMRMSSWGFSRNYTPIASKQMEMSH